MLLCRMLGAVINPSITPLLILGLNRLLSSAILGETTQNSQSHKEVANYPVKLAITHEKKR